MALNFDEMFRGLQDRNPMGIKIPEKPRMLMTETGIGFANMPGRLEQLIREYNKKLVEKGLALSRQELKAMDIIDMRGALDIPKDMATWRAPDADLSIEEKIYCVQDYWYCFMPCFERGVMQVNRSRYIQWELKNIDTENDRIMVWLRDYIFYQDTGWQPGVYGTVAIVFHDPAEEANMAVAEKRRMHAKTAVVEGVEDYGEIYGQLDLDADLHWSEADKALWKNTVIQYADNAAQHSLRTTAKSNLENLAHLFMNYAVKCNRILAENRIAASRKAPPAAARAAAEPEAAAPEAGSKPAGRAAPARRVRTIGGIEITSVPVPKPPRKRGAAVYTKLSWKTRGHLRTLKSGKKTWVKESVHKRRKLQPAENAAAPELTPVTLKIQAAKPGNETGGKTES